MSYRRKKEDNRRLKRLYEETRTSYAAGAWYSDKKKRYIKTTASTASGYTKFLRRISNKKYRKHKEIHNHCTYKKLFDYWWTLY